MHMLIEAAIWSFLAVEMMAEAYLLLLLVASLLPGERMAPAADGQRTSFCVIIPAHDEEAMLGKTVRSVLDNDYDPARFAIHVIADNCSDGTAAIARRFGVFVHERFDPERPGKGQALDWFLRNLNEYAPADAFAFVDADSTVDTNFLVAMNDRVAAGQRAIQASYRVQNPEEHPLVALRALAFALVHDLRGRGKSRLGISCGLWGNGMVMVRDCLQSDGWQSFTAVEDAEQHLRLILGGEQVHFAPETHVYGHMPGSFRASRSQQQRWEGGRLALAKRYASRLAILGVRRRNLSLLATAIELVLPPFSVQVVGAAAAVPIAWIVGGTTAGIVAISCVGLLSIYALCGFARARLSLPAYMSLAYAPVYVGWKAWLFAFELLRPRQPAWTRTSRD